MYQSLLRLLAGCYCVVLSGGVAAQSEPTYPSKPVRLVVPFGPGSNTDNLARRFADRAGPVLGTTFIIVNKPGANGLLAAQEVKAAPKDGYTVMISSASAHASNVYLFKNLGYDPVADFAPISGLTINPAVIVVRADLPVENVKQLVEYAKANPGKLNMGSGNSSSLASAALLRSMAGFTGLDVPFKSQPEAVTELIAGRIDFLSTDWITVKGQVAAGKLRVIGVTSKTRVPGLPSIPAVAETVPGFELNGWVALFSAAGVPPAVVVKLNKAAVDWVISAEFQKYTEEQGMVAFATTPEELGRFQRDQIRVWSEVLEKAGVPRGQ